MIPSSRTLISFLLILSANACADWEEEEIGMQQGEIVGGGNTDISMVPYQVALENGGFQFCGGTIISDKWIVSAAHCGVPETITAGITNLSERGAGQTRNVIRTIIFPSFQSPSSGGDISLIELDQPLDLNGTTVVAIRPLAASEKDFAAPNIIGTVSGWGDLEEGASQYPDTLQSVQVPIVSLDDAISDYGFVLTQDQVAAGFRGTGGKDSCQGDSGGPFVITDPAGATRLAGVVSWGNGCADSAFPGMYSRVSSFSDFIDEYTGGPPTAVIEAKPSASPGAEIQLKGDKSTDQGVGTVEHYLWLQTAGPTVELQDDLANPVITAPSKKGPITFKLTVFDNAGDSASTEITINISSEDGDDGVIGSCSTSGSSGLATSLLVLLGLAFLRRRAKS